jgi:hypothetical protein
MVDGEYKTIEFNSLEDVWGIIDLLKQEVIEANQEGNSFDMEKTVIKQIPFFTCPSHFYTKSINRDIERYSYCKDNNVAPYPGTYGEQPYKWTQRYFAIKNAFAKRESLEIDKAKTKANNGK